MRLLSRKARDDIDDDVVVKEMKRVLCWHSIQQALVVSRTLRDFLGVSPTTLLNKYIYQNDHYRNKNDVEMATRLVASCISSGEITSDNVPPVSKPVYESLYKHARKDIRSLFSRRRRIAPLGVIYQWTGCSKPELWVSSGSDEILSISSRILPPHHMIYMSVEEQAAAQVDWYHDRQSYLAWCRTMCRLRLDSNHTVGMNEITSLIENDDDVSRTVLNELHGEENARLTMIVTEDIRSAPTSVIAAMSTFVRSKRGAIIIAADANDLEKVFRDRMTSVEKYPYRLECMRRTLVNLLHSILVPDSSMYNPSLHTNGFFIDLNITHRPAEKSVAAEWHVLCHHSRLKEELAVAEELIFSYSSRVRTVFIPSSADRLIYIYIGQQEALHSINQSMSRLYQRDIIIKEWNAQSIRCELHLD